MGPWVPFLCLALLSCWIWEESHVAPSPPPGSLLVEMLMLLSFSSAFSEGLNKEGRREVTELQSSPAEPHLLTRSVRGVKSLGSDTVRPDVPGAASCGLPGIDVVLRWLPACVLPAP